MTSIATISPESLVLSPVEAYRWVRRNLEEIAALAVFAVIGGQSDFIITKFATGSWNIGAFYGALFNWASVQSAFLFGVYAFFLSRSEPFIKAIASTKPFSRLRRYVIRTLWLTMALTFGALPFAVAVPSIAAGPMTQPGFLLFWGFSTLLAFTSFSFIKVIRVFGKLERIQD